jgi:predicted TIM-barrel fold metal-dependent hydrolase
MWRPIVAAVLLLMPGVGNGHIHGQDAAPSSPLPLTEFKPRSMLRNIRFTPLQAAKYPVIDIHTHFGLRFRGSRERLDEFVEVMDRQNIALCVSLDARLGDTLEEHQRYLYDRYQDRFAVFVHLDFRGDGRQDQPATWDCHREDFPRRMARLLWDARQQGVCGVKFFKQFGLGYRNPDGTLIRIDDPRWDPIWQACGDLDLPVIIHTGDPAAFFQPIDQFNERYEELSRHPDWSFYGASFPTRDELLEARNRVIARHPGTRFIGAHVAGNPEDLQTVGCWLDKWPNLYVETASRIAELGRQPYTAREFLVKYQDRVLFGTDGPWPAPRLTYYWRFFETRDEYFPYSEKDPPPQGLWQIYGVELPDAVLQKLYFRNACRLIPALLDKYQRSAPR